MCEALTLTRFTPGSLDQWVHTAHPSISEMPGLLYHYVGGWGPLVG
jgi:hypothetical protein